MMLAKPTLGKNDMKAFIISLVVMAVITVVAAIGLGAIDMSADSMFSSKIGNVRL